MGAFYYYVLSLIGIYAALAWAYETFYSAVALAWGLLKQLTVGEKLVQRYGPWAVISGGSEGIGRQYALYLARKGFNIVLIALPDEKLKQTAQEIESKFSVQVKQVPVDFAQGFAVYEKLRQCIADLDVGILVNNVGTGPGHGANFDTFSLELHRLLVNVNCCATVMLTHIAVPGMKQRGRGLVINVSSVFGLAPVPSSLMYGATKAFVYSFSEALRQELRPFGVECQTVTPHFVATTLTARLLKSPLGRLISVNVDNYGRCATITIGKTVQTTGYWVHSILVTLQKLVPIDIMAKIYHLTGRSVWSESRLKSS